MATARRFKIDIHTHLLPSKLPDLEAKYGYPGFVQLDHKAPGKCDMYQGGKFFRAVEENCYCCAARLPDMDRTTVDVQVLSTVPVMFNYWAKPQDCYEISQLLNDDIADAVKSNPKKFIGLGTLPLQSPELAIQELRRCVLELGFAGVQIGTHVNEWNLDAPELFPVFEEAERLGAVIFVHPWDMLAPERMQEYWTPWLIGMPTETTISICAMIFGGVFERLPNLKVCFAHGGGSFPGTLGRIEHGFKVRPDLVAVRNKRNPREYLGKFWADSLTHDPEMLRLIVTMFGEDKIILGSDYPFPLGEHMPGELIESADFLTDEQKEKLLSTNCLAFLNRDIKDFV